MIITQESLAADENPHSDISQIEFDAQDTQQLKILFQSSSHNSKNSRNCRRPSDRYSQQIQGDYSSTSDDENSVNQDTRDELAQEVHFCGLEPITTTTAITQMNTKQEKQRFRYCANITAVDNKQSIIKSCGSKSKSDLSFNRDSLSKHTWNTDNLNTNSLLFTVNTLDSHNSTTKLLDITNSNHSQLFQSQKNLLKKDHKRHSSQQTARTKDTSIDAKKVNKIELSQQPSAASSVTTRKNKQLRDQLEYSENKIYELQLENKSIKTKLINELQEKAVLQQSLLQHEYENGQLRCHIYELSSKQYYTTNLEEKKQENEEQQQQTDEIQNLKESLESLKLKHACEVDVLKRAIEYKDTKVAEFRKFSFVLMIFVMLLCVTLHFFFLFQTTSQFEME